MATSHQIELHPLKTTILKYMYTNDSKKLTSLNYLEIAVMTYVKYTKNLQASCDASIGKWDRYRESFPKTVNLLWYRHFDLLYNNYTSSTSKTVDSMRAISCYLPPDHDPQLAFNKLKFLSILECSSCIWRTYCWLKSPSCCW